MVDYLNNTIQIIMLVVCVIAAAGRALKYRSRSWTMLSFFYGCWVLGDIYWLVCMLFYGVSPQISVVADLSWYASYIFLYLLLSYMLPSGDVHNGSIIPWFGPVFAVGMACFFMLWGEIISNMIYAALMGLLLFSSARRLTEKQRKKQYRFLPAAVLTFCLLEYGLWTSSCIWSEEVLVNPYYIFDFLLTVSFPLFIPAVGKAVSHELH